jgi:hypothetical protein
MNAASAAWPASYSPRPLGRCPRLSCTRHGASAGGYARRCAGGTALGLSWPRQKNETEILEHYIAIPVWRDAQGRIRTMVLEPDLRRQARVCARLAEECDDPYLAKRLKLMGEDMLAKADEIQELPSERLRRETGRNRLAA